MTPARIRELRAAGVLDGTRADDARIALLDIYEQARGYQRERAPSAAALRDEADRLAHRVAGQAVRELPAGVQTALEEATAGLYFGETHKHATKLRAIIRALSPELYRVLEERGELAAYEVVRGEDEVPGGV